MKRKIRQLSKTQQQKVADNIGLVHHIADLYIQQAGLYGDKAQQVKDDLVSQGYEALIRAVFGYRPELGYEFSTYACRGIWRAMLRTRELEARDRLRRHNGGMAKGIVPSAVVMRPEGEEEVRTTAVAPERDPADVIDAKALWAAAPQLLPKRLWRLLTLRLKDGLTLEQARTRGGPQSRERMRQLEAQAILELQRVYIPSIEYRHWVRKRPAELVMLVGQEPMAEVRRERPGRYRYQLDWPHVNAIRGTVGSLHEGKRVIEKFVKDVLRFKTQAA